MNNSAFRFLKSILTTKKDEMTTEYDRKEYSPFFTNLGLSQHLDAILYVNEIQQFWQVLTPEMHYQYLRGSIRTMRRKFSKWAKKKIVEEDLQLVMEYFQTNRHVAEEYLRVLLADNKLEDIKKLVEKGDI
jgi:hypothetical protein